MTGACRAGLEARASLTRLGSSFRQTTPDATWDRARRLMTACGISRVTELTPMDRLGLPVFASVRPRGQVLRVHAGKGLSPMEARIGALMEAVEFAVAEPDRSASAVHRSTVGELAEQFGDLFRFVDLAPRFNQRIDAELAVPAVRCDEVLTGRAVLLPAELVFVPFHLDAASTLFGWTTNGLASGNSRSEATLHGLLEVLERDALTMERVEHRSDWVDPEDLPEAFAALASSWQRIGVVLTVRRISNDFALPCFEAFVHESTSTDVHLASGSGLHIDRDIALARAVCEAAQSRLTTIQGAREDVTAFYEANQRRDDAREEAVGRKVLARIEDRTRSIRYRAIEHDESVDRTVDEVLGDLLRRLAANGFPAVIRHCFDADLNGLHVVKVIVPKCESIAHGSNRVGPRLMARIGAHA